MKLILIRHGETIANTKDILAGICDTALSKKGISQAKKLGKRLEKTKIDKFYSSPSKRALQTGKETLKFHKNRELHHIYGFHERSAGNWEGKNEKQLNYEKPPKNYEFDKKIMKRIKPFLKELYKKHKEQSIILFAHHDTNKAILGYLLGYRKFPHNFNQDNTCLNLIEVNFDNKKHKVKLVNCTKHLVK